MKDYYFTDFTEANYRRIIQMTKNKYQFHTYDDINQMESGVIWRHDIDASINRAEALSLVEKEEGIASTWFVLLHSSFYNLLEKEMLKKVLAIKNNGGIIGLHFDPDFYGLTNNNIFELEDKLRFEKKILETLIEDEIKVFSFHNPDIGGGFMNLEQLYIAGMLNVYHQSIRESFKYCSDSNGYWRYERLEDVIKKGNINDKLHILTHPALWQKEAMSPRDRHVRCVEGRAKYTMRKHDDLLKAFNRENLS